MASDRLRRAALDGDQDALVELWRLNTRSPLPASSACCGPCDEHLSCRTTGRTIDELALELGLHPERVRDQMAVRLQREPGRRELRGALTVAMDLMAAHGISASAAWRTVMGLVLRDPWGYSFDDSEPRRAMHEPCAPRYTWHRLWHGGFCLSLLWPDYHERAAHHAEGVTCGALTACSAEGTHA